MDGLIERLRQLTAGRVARVRLHTPELQVLGGFEERVPPAAYRWDGMRRGGNPAHPYLVFQYTLDGWGCYTAQGTAQRLRPGMGFTAIIPSEHVYELPPASSGWTFFWIIMHHPYVVERVARQQGESGAVLSLDPGGPAVLRALDLLEHVFRPAPRDAIAHERALFEFLWEYERAAGRSAGAQSEGERLREEVRGYVLGALQRPVGVDELAALRGQSRSRFSHAFKAATGIGPAKFVQQVRLEEAARRLLHTGQLVDDIARDTGFASANHFCRVFRQRFRLSPGAFRRQMRS
jgi:AraC-like DNA-binding protein